MDEDCGENNSKDIHIVGKKKKNVACDTEIICHPQHWNIFRILEILVLFFKVEIEEHSEYLLQVHIEGVNK